MRGVQKKEIAAEAWPKEAPKPPVGKNHWVLVLLLLGVMFVLALVAVAGIGMLATPFGCVAVIEIQGDIVSGDSPATLFSDSTKGAGTIADEIAEADSRPDVKSILLLIDSPGGSVVASRQLYEAVKGTDKPTVAYINEMGASGAYYAAAATDQIVANPNALTGSIGAKMTLDDFSGLFGKLGYNSTVIKTGEMKDIGSSSRPITDEERAVLQSIVDESFQEFRSSIEESRGERLNSALFNQALDGRVLSGRQAKRAGLVDQLGSQIDAEELAARLGNITGKPRLCEISLDKRKSMFGSLGAEIEKIVAGASASPPKLSYK